MAAEQSEENEKSTVYSYLRGRVSAPGDWRPAAISTQHHDMVTGRRPREVRCHVQCDSRYFGGVGKTSTVDWPAARAPLQDWSRASDGTDEVAECDEFARRL